MPSTGEWYLTEEHDMDVSHYTDLSWLRHRLIQPTYSSSGVFLSNTRRRDVSLFGASLIISSSRKSFTRTTLRSLATEYIPITAGHGSHMLIVSWRCVYPVKVE
uniref:Uncharacterized protein n=1 Tax=Bionectria ochroleuca TaxID=29856 RepID=A0A8H7N280_BIOOC